MMAENSRTGFVWQGLESPVQAVLCRATLPFRTEDWCGFDEAEQQARLSGLRDQERCEGFDLATAPLMRLVNDRPKIPGYRETVAALGPVPAESTRDYPLMTSSALRCCGSSNYYDLC